MSDGTSSGSEVEDARHRLQMPHDPQIENGVWAELPAIEAERDRLRAALEQVSGHFIECKPHEPTKTYAGPIKTLTLIRAEVAEALGDPPTCPECASVRRKAQR